MLLYSLELWEPLYCDTITEVVKKMAKHDYESHMILLTVYTHFLYQTITLGKSLSWTEVFDETETEDHKRLMKDKKLTIFAVA